MEEGKNQKIQEVLSRLTKDQLRVVVAMQEHQSKEAAAKVLRIPVKTIYNWGDIIDEAARLIALDTLNSALEIRRRNLAKAMAVKAAGLDSKSEAVRQKAATEIIEWEIGKANQPVSGEVTIGVKHIDYRTGVAPSEE